MFEARSRDAIDRAGVSYRVVSPLPENYPPRAPPPVRLF